MFPNEVELFPKNINSYRNISTYESVKLEMFTPKKFITYT